MSNTPNRCDYLNGRATHREYYAAIATDGGASARLIPQQMLDACRASTDPHFNDVPLSLWDGLATGRPIPAELANAFRNRGDYATLSGLVSLWKEVARQYVETREQK